MIRFFSCTDQLLRPPVGESTADPAGWHLRTLLLQLVLFGLLYGAAMGSYGVWEGKHALQVLYSALKVPLLLTATFLLSIPSFFVLNTLLGVRNDFGFVLRALIATQTGLTIILASLAPLTLFWYLSMEGYHSAIVFNAAMFGAASLFAQGLLQRYYRRLIQSNPRHQWLRRIWLFIYAFVGIQMGWVLRPFIGNLNEPTLFFRAQAWGNAYEKMLQILLHAFQ